MEQCPLLYTHLVKQIEEKQCKNNMFQFTWKQNDE